MRGTQSVGVTMIFWLIGAVAAMAGTLVFVEFGLTIPRYRMVDGIEQAVPKNGGELNYV